MSMREFCGSFDDSKRTPRTPMLGHLEYGVGRLMDGLMSKTVERMQFVKSVMQLPNSWDYTMLGANQD
jgi:hypothetical protein